MIEPRKPRPIPARIPRRELVRLVLAVEKFVYDMEELRGVLSTPLEKLTRTKSLVTALAVAKDVAKRAGLGEEK